MGYFDAVIMGIIQGITEFLPISSTGHLAIFGKLFGINEPELAFDILLHIGTLFAVIVVFFSDIKKLVAECFKLLADLGRNIAAFVMSLTGKEVKYHKMINSSYRKFVLLLLVSTIPTGIIGMFLKSTVSLVKSDLSIVGISLLITACLLIVSDTCEEGTKKPKNVSYANALGVGVAQGLSVIPGLSRTGVTISVCTKFGFEPRFAVKYSFILSIPAILGAAIVDFGEFTEKIKVCESIAPYIAGTIAAAFVGYFCIHTMLRLVTGKKMKYFAGYCAAAGVLSCILHFAM